MSRLLILAPVALLAVACSPAVKPLPGGLPPEYEAPRAFDPNALENSPGKPVVAGPQPPAPTGTNLTTPAPSAGPVPAPPAPPPPR